jgi:hypothetical protein
MSDEYVAEISIPLTYQNLPADKILNNNDDHINIRLRGNGGDIFALKFFTAEDDILVNLQKLDLKKSRYFDKYYILTNQFRNQVANRFKFDHTLLSFGPDTIYLNFEDIISKSLKVIPDIEIQCKAQYQVHDSLLIEPAEVMVSGPASSIDTLENIYTSHQVFSDLRKTTTAELPLLIPLANEKVKYSATSVQMIIPVEAYTESSIELPIHLITGDSGINIKTFPGKITLTYQVAVKDYNKVSADMFHMSVYYDPENDMEKTFLRVRAEKSPDFIKISRIQPDKVEFIIHK